MSALKSSGFDSLLKDWIAADRPFFGICLGLQVLFEWSEEGNAPGLSIFPGKVSRFRLPAKFKVPHMGWNAVCQKRQHPLWQGIADMTRFYFVHSYYVHAEDRSLLAASVEYGVSADAALARDNLFAVQFHPEKSAGAGLQLLRNFIGWSGTC